MSFNSIEIILLLVAFISMFIIRFNRSRFIKRYVCVFTVVFVFIPILLGLLLFAVQNTDTKFDLYSILLYSPLLVLLIGIIEKVTRKYTNLYFVFNSIVYLVLFLIFYQLTMHLLDSSSSYLVFMIPMAISTFRVINKRKDRELLIIANIIGILLVFVTSWVFSIPFDGITKQERIAMGFLQEQKGYESSNIIKIYDLTPPKEGKDRFLLVKVQTNNGVKDYTLHYKSGEIVEVEEL